MLKETFEDKVANAVATKAVDTAVDRYSNNPDLLVKDAEKAAYVAQKVASNPVARKAASGLLSAFLSGASAAANAATS